MLALTAYALLGKGFAYLGVSPFYAGEIVLLLGIAAFVLSGCWLAVLTTVPSLLLTLLIAWSIARTLPYFGVYRFDSLRDSAVIVYGSFAFIMAALLVERPKRLWVLVSWLSRLLFILCPFVVLAYCIARANGMTIVAWPLQPPRAIELRPGEIAVHLAGAASLALVGIMRVNRLWLAALLLGVALIATQSRGGTLAFLVPVLFTAVMMNQIKALLRILLIAVVTMAAAYALDIKVNFNTDQGDRSLGVQQIVENLTSIFVSSEEGNLDDTKQWRLRWWSDIRNYTLDGPYFWTGKGFGINLAESDGYVTGGENGEPPLRSPHNVHMTILARAGLPGFVLWGLLGVSWLAMTMRNVYLARTRQEPFWASFFLFLTAYVIANVINASFDVALEGPMLGIWFWAQIGIGIGASMIYRGSSHIPFEELYGSG